LVDNLDIDSENQNCYLKFKKKYSNWRKL